tara:strand:+ start:11443 stop:11748 length:306 start_codon:yes stop_codon:yes gene_type:complete
MEAVTEWERICAERKERDKQIFQERKTGKKLNEIALEYGLSNSRIQQICRKQKLIERGIKLRAEYIKKPLKERLELERIQREKSEKVYRDVQKIFGKDLVP